MKSTTMSVCSLTLMVALGSLSASVAADPADRPADRATVLAEVNGEPITLGELRRLIGELRADAQFSGSSMPDVDPVDLVERLVNLHLVFQEARNIGLDELPEFETAVNAFRTDTLRGLLLADVMADLPPPSAEAIEARYRELASEFELSSALFPDREAAEAFRAGLADQAAFAAAAEREREAGGADRVEIGAWVARRDLAPEITVVVDSLADGAVGEPFALGTGFAVVQRLGVRVPENAELRETAARDVVTADRDEALGTFGTRLRAERIHVDTELLDSLDFDGQVDQFDTFLADDRVVATLDDAEPVRVADVAAAIKKRLFHGVEQAAEKGRINRTKGNVVEELTTERALQAEARRRGIDRRPEFVEDLLGYENRVLFGMFVRWVVDKDVRVSVDDVRAEYEANIADFTDPGMVRLESIVFADADSARRALERVNAGADFAWTRVNATGQAAAVPPESVLDGRLLMIEVLPDGLRDAIEGAAAGDFRLYAEATGLQHLVVVLDRVEPRPRPFEQVQNEIGKKLQIEARQAALDGWFAKLRAVSEIEIRFDGDALRDLVNAGAAARS